MIHKLLAQTPSGGNAGTTVTDPLGINSITPPTPGGKGVDEGLSLFINNGFKIVFIGFGLYAMINFVLAAYAIISAQGEAKNIEKAKKMITNSVIALVLLSFTFIFAGIMGQVIFGKWNYFLDITGSLKTIAP